MPKIDRQAIYERDNGLCGFCGQPVPFEIMHLDHYPMPRSLGGLATPDNLRVAHKRCNTAEGYAVVREQRRLRGVSQKVGVVIINSRIPPDVLDQVRALAEAETRSVNGQLVQLVREALAARGSD